MKMTQTILRSVILGIHWKGQKQNIQALQAFQMIGIWIVLFRRAWFNYFYGSETRPSVALVGRLVDRSVIIS